MEKETLKKKKKKIKKREKKERTVLCIYGEVTISQMLKQHFSIVKISQCYLYLLCSTSFFFFICVTLKQIFDHQYRQLQIKICSANQFFYCQCSHLIQLCSNLIHYTQMNIKLFIKSY
jgi:hypothetical protein